MAILTGISAKLRTLALSEKAAEDCCSVRAMERSTSTSMEMSTKLLSTITRAIPLERMNLGRNEGEFIFLGRGEVAMWLLLEF